MKIFPTPSRDVLRLVVANEYAQAHIVYSHEALVPGEPYTARLTDPAITRVIIGLMAGVPAGPVQAGPEDYYSMLSGGLP